MHFVYIGLFGALGCLARYFVSGWVYTFFGRGLPWGTLAVNIAGSFLLGLIMEGSLRSTLLSPEVRVGLSVGFMGGFTTFSTFSYETFRLLEEGSFLHAGANALLNVAVCILFAALGISCRPSGVNSREKGKQMAEEHTLMRIFVGESDRWQKKPLHEALVELFRTEGFAGATVLKGCMGFGVHSTMHSDKLLRLSTDLPVVIEVVDRQEKIDAILPRLETMLQGGMLTLEKARVIRFPRKIHPPQD